MHVSPFMPMEQTYEWNSRGARRAAGRADRQPRAQELVFEASLALRRRELTRAAMTCPSRTRRRCWRRSRGSTATARLKLKGAPFHPTRRRRGDRARREAALHRVLRRVRAGRLELVEAWSGERLRFGPAEAELRAEITIHSPRFYALVARRRSVGLGEAYADGLWDSDDLVTVFRIGALELRRADAAQRRLAPFVRPPSASPSCRCSTRGAARGTTSPPTTTSATSCSSSSSTASR